MQRLIGKEWSGINVATRFVNNITESCDIQSYRNERERRGRKEGRREGGKEGRREGVRDRGRDQVGEGESRRKWV